MGTLVFVCPTTGAEVSTGIEMDVATLHQLELSKVFCPHCRQQHQMAGIPNWLAIVGTAREHVLRGSNTASTAWAPHVVDVNECRQSVRLRR